MSQPERDAAPASVAAEAAAQYLTFSLGEEVFAMDIRTVREIIQYGSTTPVPLMPDFVRGVMNLRGAVVPVIDLAARFRQAATEPTRRTCIVIFEVYADDGRHTLGVMVDAVHEVLEIDGQLVDPPPSFGTRVAPEFIRGMARLDKRIVILLDLDRVLSVAELETLAEPAA